MDLATQYLSFNKALETLKEEYKVMPSKFLLKQIELAEKQTKQIEDAMSKETTKT